MDLTKEHKISFLNVHYYFEIIMFHNISNKLLNGASNDRLINNLLIEGFVLHLRNLIEFYCFKKDNRYKDDARAYDFIKTDLTKANWFEIIEPEKAVFKALDIVDKANKQIAHLTYTRIFNEIIGKEWPLKKLMSLIFKITIKFLNNLNPVCSFKKYDEVFGCSNKFLKRLKIIKVNISNV